MRDYQDRLDSLLKEATDCELIAQLATDRLKSANFYKLAQQYRQMAEDLREMVASVPSAS